VTAALVQATDVIGTTVRLLQAAADTAGAGAAGLIMRQLGPDRLQLLAATSHRAEELEVYQSQHGQGPCFDAVDTGETVRANSGEEIADRWPTVAAAFDRAGYRAVQTVPLRWHDDVIGALNFFWTEGAAPGDWTVGEIFANLATLIVIHSDPVSGGQVLDRTRSALNGRTIIERAKGVLAQDKNLTMDVAYDSLLEQAARNGQLITATAAEIVGRAEARPTGPGVG
jgi:hypothetical protein